MDHNREEAPRRERVVVTHADQRAPAAASATMRPPEFRPRRRRWPGVLAAMLIGGAIAALMVSSYYEEQTIGQRIDDTIAVAGQTVQQGVQDVKAGAEAVADKGVQAGERIADKLDDAGITAAVKTALAADPSLSALAIDVTTRDGVVALQGPAPDAQSRERAGVLAAAPKGVVRVDNQLVISGMPLQRDAVAINPKPSS